MISYVKGELAAIEEQKAIIDVGGIGYGVFMPHQALAMLPSVGNEVKLYTYLNAVSYTHLTLPTILRV